MSIKRITGKETVQYTLQQYGDELAESSIAEKRTNIGELVIDVGGSPDNPTLWVANINGFLNQIQGGGNGGGNVNKIIAGNGIFISPDTGIGDVTINALPIQVEPIPPVYFTAPTTGNNQQFSDPTLSLYSSNVDVTLFLNGVLLENQFYTLSGDTLTVTTDITVGDSIDIPRAYIVSNTFPVPGGNNGEIQFNNGGLLGGVTTATYDGIQFTLGSNSDIRITGGNVGQVLITDGAGNLSWGPGGGGGNLVIEGRDGNVNVAITGGVLVIEGRTGNIDVVIG